MTAVRLPFDTLGAFCRDNHVALAPIARGALDGLRFAAKDVFDIAGTRSGFGNPDWLRTHAPASVTAPVIETLRAAGAELIGRTVTDELTYSLSGENAHYGTPLNPAAPDRIPGGSSSGSASATAGGVVDFALGTDCGGSVRLPASYCGILGMRPSHGRISTEGAIPFAPSFDVIGWFARDAAVFEQVGCVLFDAAPCREGASVLTVVSEAFELAGAAIADALSPAITKLGDTIGKVRRARVSTDGLAQWFEVFRIVQGAEIWANRRAWIERAKPVIGPGIRERLDWAATIDAATTIAARARHAAIRAHLVRLLGAGEILCLPTSPRVAPLKGTNQDTLEVEYRAQAMCLLCIAGLGGLPQISVPVATFEGLPLGLSLIGAPGSDMLLLAEARRLLAG